jgi:hypothetical protein
MGTHSESGRDETLRDDLRRRIRAVMLWSVWTVLWFVPTVFCLVMAVAEWTGWDPARDQYAALGAVFIGSITGALTAVGVNRLWRLYREPPRFEPAPARRRSYRLPRPGSSTRAPLRRLAKAEAVLTDLLDGVDDPRIPPEWIEQTRQAIARTSANLRGMASGIEAAERSVDRAKPRWQREILAENVLDRLNQLNRGLDGYDRLIEAAGEVVAASASAVSMDELTDATDRLNGLAQALREL